MPHDADHVLERRVKMLSAAFIDRVEILKAALAPAGTRPLFTQHLSNADALKFWRAHRYDDLGQRVLANMKPQDVLELDSALAQANEAEQMPIAEGGYDGLS